MNYEIRFQTIKDLCKANDPSRNISSDVNSLREIIEKIVKGFTIGREIHNTEEFVPRIEGESKSDLDVFKSMKSSAS